MTIDLVNFARHAKTKELRWMAGRQFPLWIKYLLARKAAGDDPGFLIDQLAQVCSVTDETEVLP